MWDLPGSGIEPVSPALAGGFFATEPPGNPGVNFCWLLYLLTLAHLLFLFLCMFSNLKNCILDIWLIFCRDSGFSYVSLKRIEFCFSRQWVFIGRTDVEAETPILWVPDVKSWLIWKNPDAGKDWRQEEKGMTEDETVGWHHHLNGRWVWVDSGSWWWTGRPGVLWSTEFQRVGHDWVTELNWNWLGSNSKYCLLKWAAAENPI